VSTEDQSFGFIVFGLERFYHRMGYISCANDYPINTCQIGDYLEIDMDKIEKSEAILDTSVARKFGSTAVVSSNSSQQLTTNQFQAMGNQMMDRAERSNGQMEARLIAREEYRRDGSISAREFGWSYGKK